MQCPEAAVIKWAWSTYDLQRLARSVRGQTCPGFIHELRLLRSERMDIIDHKYS